MAVRVGINGFGRIGRSFTRAILARGEQANVELVAVNDPFGDAHTMAFLLKHDSVGGTLKNEVKEDTGGFSIDGTLVHKLEVKEPSEIPWGEHGVDVVIESTGLFTARERPPLDLVGGAKRVIISGTFGRRRRDGLPRRERRLLRPEAAHRRVERVSVHDQLPRTDDARLDERFGIEQGLINTVHAYTSDQQLQDQAVSSRSGKPERPPPLHFYRHPRRRARGTFGGAPTSAGERPAGALDVWLCPCLNPTGFPLNRRENGKGLDLNRQYRTRGRRDGGAHRVAGTSAKL